MSEPSQAVRHRPAQLSALTTCIAQSSSLVTAISERAYSQPDRADGCDRHEGGSYDELVWRDGRTVHPMKKGSNHKRCPATELDPSADLRRGKLSLFRSVRLIVLGSDFTHNVPFQGTGKCPPPGTRSPQLLAGERPTRQQIATHPRQRCQWGDDVQAGSVGRKAMDTSRRPRADHPPARRKPFVDGVLHAIV